MTLMTMEIWTTVFVTLMTMELWTTVFMTLMTVELWTSLCHLNDNGIMNNSLYDLDDSGIMNESLSPSWQWNYERVFVILMTMELWTSLCYLDNVWELGQGFPEWLLQGFQHLPLNLHLPDTGPLARLTHHLLEVEKLPQKNMASWFELSCNFCRCRCMLLTPTIWSKHEKVQTNAYLF